MVIDLLRDLLSTPSDFAGDPAGGIGNQAAHAVAVGGGLFLLALPGCHRLFAAPAVAAWQAALILYAGWEAAQFAYGATLVDALTDWAFVATGATLYWTLWRDDPAWARRLAASLAAALVAHMLLI